MKFLKLGALATIVFLACCANAQQQADFAFGVGSVIAPSSNASGQGMGGGAYPAISGDVLLKHGLGFEGEVAWRASQNLYGGYQPFRPILYAFNGVYAPKLGKHVQLELLGGLGGESIRFYTQTYVCNYYSCTNYFSSNHFMGDVGAAVKFYVHGGFFVRPEFREYFINNNVEFNSGHATRAGVSIGYTFGGGS
jgi:hypothetical protein